MNQGDLIEKVAKQASISKSEAERAINAVKQAITDSLRKNEKVTLVGLDTFAVSHRRARRGHNRKAERIKPYDEIVDFFARGTSSTGVLGYHPSAQARERVRYLLAKNKAGTLTSEESAELELFGELEHFMQLVKARAHEYVESES